MANKFCVEFSYTEMGEVHVEAETAEEAAEQVLQTLEDYGVEELGQYNITHRDYDADTRGEVVSD